MKLSKSQAVAPLDDEVEVALLGPGFGESLVLHLGHGDWVVVDSCLERGSKECLPLRYLEALGIDVSTMVRRIVVTHAHNDHIGGLSALVDACEQAQIWISAAATFEELGALLKLDESLLNTQNSTYSEYRKVVEILIARNGRQRGIGPPLTRQAMAERPVFRRAAADGIYAAELASLSPSDRANELARTEFARRAGLVGQRRRGASRDPNELAVALRLEVGEGAIRVLLGSDLLVGPGEYCGWNAVLSQGLYSSQPAQLVKVSHHGSKTGDHPRVWQELVLDQHYAILTPFRQGRTQLPTPEDRERICGRTSDAFISASPTVPAQSSAIKRASRKLPPGRRVTERDGLPGVVRMRKQIGLGGDEWRTELIAPARQLCDRRASRRRRA